ncbi:hypothetical protein K466DRAFT_668639, partial [Polyporus arcularius HHB13444]
MIAFWTFCAEQDAHVRSGRESSRTSTQPRRALKRPSCVSPGTAARHGDRDGSRRCSCSPTASGMSRDGAVRAGSYSGRTCGQLNSELPAWEAGEFSSSSPAHLSNGGDTRALVRARTVSGTRPTPTNHGFRASDLAGGGSLDEMVSTTAGQQSLAVASCSQRHS